MKYPKKSLACCQFLLFQELKLNLQPQYEPATILSFVPAAVGHYNSMFQGYINLHVMLFLLIYSLFKDIEADNTHGESV